ncbi:unnamed protein product [Zymoseptoria tritici ST99CH_3D1]|nr:unnamed protein product [Zymoseptoria tritici ST99CH_3D1]
MAANGETQLPSGPPPTIETTFLIVGAGPAGASLGCFLAARGLTGIIISAAKGTAKEPRAHITNAAALECLRDIGLEGQAKANATPGESMQHTRWCHDMAGEEYARIHSWGNQPERRGEYHAASPCRHVDLPQTELEPILVKHALDNGFTVRFDSSFVEYQRDSPGGPITSTIKDDLTGQTYTIRSKYLIGCDGARSQIMRQLDIPLLKKPGQGLAINVLAKVDLSKYIRHRMGNLHYIFTPDLVHPPWGWMCVLRMVKAWNEWMFILLPEPGFEDLRVRPSHDEYMKRLREIVGDDSIPIEIKDVSKWYINEIVAERYSDGNIFCLGDAVHRHPPFNGLGSNTCVQDAYNLAWKLAYVEKELADPKLLDTFSVERQPIGAGVVQRANQGLRDHHAVWEALGVLPKDVEERKVQHAELSAPTPAGRERRKRLQGAIAHTAHEFGALGIEMNQWYESSAIYTADETQPREEKPADPVMQYQITTYPGARLPHAWLNKREPEDPISTIDLAGRGAFCLLTGAGGKAWKEAAVKAGKELSVPLTAYSIGWAQDWEDVYGDWDRRREVEDDGCVLRLKERQRCFNVAELHRLAAEAVSRKVEDIVSFEKLGEGAANRAFAIQFRDGFKLVARIPYLVTEPRQQIVASEAATMTFLRSKGLPVPAIYGYSATADNPTETEYIFLEFCPGRNLASLWVDMDEHHRSRFIRSLVDLERRLFEIRLPASGSLYFLRDLSAACEKVAVDSGDASSSASYYVGPSTSLPLWYGRRSGLDVDRGPYTETKTVLNAGAKKEIEYLARHGRPLLPFNRMLRETFNLEKQQPSIHLDSLQKYLKISEALIPSGEALVRPVIRHPDLRPSNIFVSDDYEITSFIDWQNATILPLFLQSGPLDDFDSLGSASRLETSPRPDGLAASSEDSRLEQLELFSKQQLHHLYMTETSKNNPTHYEALSIPFAVGRRKTYDLSSAPWQGDNVPLRSSLIFLKQQWSQLVTAANTPCPITFAEEEEREYFRLDDLEQEATEQLKGSMEMLGLGPEGWVSNEKYKAATEAIARMKEMCLEQAETELERVAIRDHWVYDDLEEEEYL